MKCFTFLILSTLILSCSKNICPLKNGVIYKNDSSLFSMTDPNNQITIESDFSEVYSVSAGEIVSIITTSGDIKTVLVKTENADQKDYFYIYSGLQKVNYTKGNFVQKNDILGELKSKGDKYELSFQYRENTVKQNPRKCIKCKKN